MSAMYQELHRALANIDDMQHPMDNAIRDVLGIALSFDTYKLRHEVRLLATRDVAKTVTEATGLHVDHVTVVTPDQVAAEMLLWPPKHTLWEEPALPALIRRAPEKHASITRYHHMVTQGIDDLAMYGVRKNHHRCERDLRDQLVRQFGHVAGDACANHLALCIVGDMDAVKRTGALLRLFHTAPFITRNPLNPHKLLILVDNDI